MAFTINPPNTPLVGSNGMVEPAWYRFFANIQRVTGGQDNPIDFGSFLTLADSPALGSDRVFTPSPGQLTGTDGGAGSSYTLGLANTAVTPNPYGGATKTVSFTVDAKGRLVAAAEFTLSTTNVAEGSNLYFTDARARSALSGSGGISYNSGTGAFTLDTASNRNVDHSAVSVTAGAGLAGGGDITATRTLDVGAGTGITVNANDVALDTSSTRNTDHASVTLTAGAGLTGGGDITANRTFDIGAGTGITVNANDVALTVLTAFGTYTPTLTNVTNVTASTAFACQYSRVGNTVTVSGYCNVQATAGTTLTELGISLPIASNLANAQECCGTAAAYGTVNQSGAILADVTNDRASLRYLSVDTTNRSMGFIFTYQVI